MAQIIQVYTKHTIWNVVSTEQEQQEPKVGWKKLCTKIDDATSQLFLIIAIKNKILNTYTRQIDIDIRTNGKLKSLSG